MSLEYPVGSAKVTATVAGTALTLITFGFTAAQVNAAKRAYITVRTGAISVTWVSGVTAVAADGICFPAGGTYEVEGPKNLQNLSMIRDTATSATVTIILEG
jgi:hypothetical protein